MSQIDASSDYIATVIVLWVISSVAMFSALSFWFGVETLIATLAAVSAGCVIGITGAQFRFCRLIGRSVFEMITSPF